MLWPLMLLSLARQMDGSKLRSRGKCEVEVSMLLPDILHIGIGHGTQKEGFMAACGLYITCLFR